ncbi:MAG: lamin tail domain-containing protein, partial [Candidatus Nealsonbacteria bacterium]|nr:lamin tail domain-containing protein [Candidatus Nealsonbacteria bacterium]
VNNHTLADEDGDFSDWIEIHNPAATPIDLDGWYLTDKADNLTKWQFPSRIIEPGGHLVVFASDEDRIGAELHTNFKLSSDGEYLALVEPDGTTVAHAFAPEFPLQSSDVSYGPGPGSASILIREEAQVAFHVPIVDDVALGTGWTDPGFDDTDWSAFANRSPVLITETTTSAPDYVEIQCVAPETVDTTGWLVAVNDGSRFEINDVFPFEDPPAPPILWHLPASMAPGEVLYRHNDAAWEENDNPLVDAEHYWGDAFVWATQGPGWVLLIDDGGRVVDFVVWGYGDVSLAGFNVTVDGHDFTIDDVWLGSSIPAGGNRTNSLQRSGTADHDHAMDWKFSIPDVGAQPSIGDPNEGLDVSIPGSPTTGIGFNLGASDFGDALQTDVATEMHELNASLWTRIEFNVNDPAALSSLTLQMKYNDGFVAYLNGTPVASSNAPTPLEWNSSATASRDAATTLQYEEFNVGAHVGELVVGRNVLAIQGLNFDAADNDLLILPRLVGSTSYTTPRYFYSPTPGASNSGGFVVINEVHYDPEDNAVRGEFIELYNTTASNVDLSGWMLDDGIRYRFADGTVLLAGDYLVVAEDPATMQAKFGAAALGPWVGRLDNDGERIRLVNQWGDIVDEVEYVNAFPWPIAARGDFSSMELIHPSLDNSLGGNWRPSGYNTLTLAGREIAPADATPTPGQQNSVFSTDAAPQIGNVAHGPQHPLTAEPVTVTAEVTDPNGIASVELRYQLVAPGNYIPAFLPLPHGTLLSDPERPFDPNPAFEDPANWTTLLMTDDGNGADAVGGDNVYTATIPAQSVNRMLVRYRISAADQTGLTVTAPYLDDPSLNFAFYVYDGLPDYTADTRSVLGAGHTYSSEMLESLPVYTLITRDPDLDDCIGYSSADQIPSGNDGARRKFNWEGTFVYDGDVYDHILYRLRQRNDRYGLAGKRSMRFRFCKGNYLQAYDNFGNPYPELWRTLNTGKMFDNKDIGNFGLTETLNNNLWNLMGVPAPWMHTFHFRVVKGADEAPAGANGQYYGDFWGMYLAVEDYDTRFLDAHDMPDGNLYKLKDAIFDANRLKRHQGRDSVTTGADFQNIRNNLRPTQSDAWLNNHVNYEASYAYHAVVEGIRHYDFRPADSHSKNRAMFFEPYEGSEYGRLWTLPHDADASWGPSWNSGIDYSSAAIANKANFQQDYRNVLREFRDLVWTEEVIHTMIDELAAIVVDFSSADRDRWKDAPADAGRQDFGTMESKVVDMKGFAFTGWTGSTGPNVGPGGRAAHLDNLANAGGDSSAIPNTPTITSTAPASFPVDALSFQ